MSSKITSNKQVIIYWEDSKIVTQRWEWLDDLEEANYVQCVSIGTVVFENDKVVRIASTYDKEMKQSCSVIDIPKSCIKKIKRI